MYINGKKILGFSIPQRVDGLKIYSFSVDPSMGIVFDTYEDYEDFKTYDAIKVNNYLFTKFYAKGDQVIFSSNDGKVIRMFKFTGFNESAQFFEYDLVSSDYVDEALIEKVNGYNLELEVGNIYLRNKDNALMGEIAPNTNYSGWEYKNWCEKFKRTPNFIKVKEGSAITPHFNDGIVSVVEYDENFNFIKTRRVFDNTEYQLKENTRYIKFDIGGYSKIDGLYTLEMGAINYSTGVNEDSTSRIRTAEFIDIDSFSYVFFKNNLLFLRFYDANKAYLGQYAVDAKYNKDKPQTALELYALSNGDQTIMPKYLRVVIPNVSGETITINDEPTCFELVNETNDFSAITLSIDYVCYAREAKTIKNKRPSDGILNFVFSYTPHEGFRDILDPTGDEKQYVDNNELYYKSGHLMLPPNYTQEGKAVKLILFAHGSGDFNGFHNTGFGTYEEYIRYLSDEGYAVFDCYDWDLRYKNMSTNFGSPSTIAGIIECYKWVLNNFNVSQDPIFITGKSAGGFKAIPFMWNKGMPIACLGLLSPDIDGISSASFGGYNTESCIALCKDFGFIGDYETILTSGTTEEKKQLFKSNLDKLLGYTDYFNGSIGNETQEEVYDMVYNGAWNEGYLPALKRIAHYPIKIWGALDDTAIYGKSKAFIQSLKNTGSIAELRTFQEGLGGHHAVDNDANAPKVDITTKLGIKHTNIPLAYVEVIAWFSRFGGE